MGTSKSEFLKDMVSFKQSLQGNLTCYSYREKRNRRT